MKALKLIVAAFSSSLLLLGAVPATSQKDAKTTTGSSGSVSALQNVQVLVKYSLQYYPATTTRFDHLLLFPDGTAFANIPTKPMSSFNAATLRSLLDAEDVGRWKVVGETLVLALPKETRKLRKHPHGWYDGKGAIPTDSAYDVYYPVISPPRAKMLGAWKNENLIVMGTAGGGSPMVASGSRGDWMFNANGTFSDGAKSFTSATTANMGDAYKGDGDVVSNANRVRKSSGTWRIDGAILTLEKEGRRTVHLAFLMPYWTKNKDQTDLMIDGERWKRPGKD